MGTVGSKCQWNMNTTVCLDTESEVSITDVSDQKMVGNLKWHSQSYNDDIQRHM